jgi:hypothetical protein
MTFTEYKNQENPRRKPSVYITDEDCEQIIGRFKTREIVLDINGHIATYVIEEDCPHLIRTMDRDGNPRGFTCFRWCGSDLFSKRNSN